MKHFVYMLLVLCVSSVVSVSVANAFPPPPHGGFAPGVHPHPGGPYPMPHPIRPVYGPGPRVPPPVFVPGWEPGWEYRRPRHYYDDSVVVASCAPEIVYNNLVNLDKNLTDLVQTPEFSQSNLFKEQIQYITSLNSKEKLQAYFSLIGIDYGDNAQVAAFLGARDIDPQWINMLQQNSNLTNSQAQQVIGVVDHSLVGELQ